MTPRLPPKLAMTLGLLLASTAFASLPVTASPLSDLLVTGTSVLSGDQEYDEVVVASGATLLADGLVLRAHSIVVDGVIQGLDGTASAPDAPALVLSAAGPFVVRGSILGGAGYAPAPLHATAAGLYDGQDGGDGGSVLLFQRDGASPIEIADGATVAGGAGGAGQSISLATVAATADDLSARRAAHGGTGGTGGTVSLIGPLATLLGTLTPGAGGDGGAAEVTTQPLAIFQTPDPVFAATYVPAPALAVGGSGGDTGRTILPPPPAALPALDFLVPSSGGAGGAASAVVLPAPASAPTVAVGGPASPASPMSISVATPAGCVGLPVPTHFLGPGADPGDDCSDAAGPLPPVIGFSGSDSDCHVVPGAVGTTTGAALTGYFGSLSGAGVAAPPFALDAVATAAQDGFACTAALPGMLGLSGIPASALGGNGGNGAAGGAGGAAGSIGGNGNLGGPGGDGSCGLMDCSPAAPGGDGGPGAPGQAVGGNGGNAYFFLVAVAGPAGPATAQGGVGATGGDGGSATPTTFPFPLFSLETKGCNLKGECVDGAEGGKGGVGGTASATSGTGGNAHATNIFLPGVPVNPYTLILYLAPTAAAGGAHATATATSGTGGVGGVGGHGGDCALSVYPTVPVSATVTTITPPGYGTLSTPSTADSATIAHPVCRGGKGGVGGPGAEPGEPTSRTSEAGDAETWFEGAVAVQSRGQGSATATAILGDGGMGGMGGTGGSCMVNECAPGGQGGKGGIGSNKGTAAGASYVTQEAINEGALGVLQTGGEFWADKAVTRSLDVDASDIPTLMFIDARPAGDAVLRGGTAGTGGTGGTGGSCVNLVVTTSATGSIAAPDLCIGGAGGEAGQGGEGSAAGKATGGNADSVEDIPAVPILHRGGNGDVTPANGGHGGDGGDGGDAACGGVHGVAGKGGEAGAASKGSATFGKGGDYLGIYQADDGTATLHGASGGTKGSNGNDGASSLVPLACDVLWTVSQTYDGLNGGNAYGSGLAGPLGGCRVVGCTIAATANGALNTLSDKLDCGELLNVVTVMMPAMVPSYCDVLDWVASSPALTTYARVVYCIENTVLRTPLGLDGVGPVAFACPASDPVGETMAWLHDAPEPLPCVVFGSDKLFCVLDPCEALGTVQAFLPTADAVLIDAVYGECPPTVCGVMEAAYALAGLESGGDGVYTLDGLGADVTPCLPDLSCVAALECPPVCDILDSFVRKDTDGEGSGSIYSIDMVELPCGLTTPCTGFTTGCLPGPLPSCDDLAAYLLADWDSCVPSVDDVCDLAGAGVYFRDGDCPPTVCLTLECALAACEGVSLPGTFDSGLCGGGCDDGCGSFDVCDYVHGRDTDYGVPLCGDGGCTTDCGTPDPCDYVYSKGTDSGLTLCGDGGGCTTDCGTPDACDYLKSGTSDFALGICGDGGGTTLDVCEYLHGRDGYAKIDPCGDGGGGALTTAVAMVLELVGRTAG